MAFSASIRIALSLVVLVGTLIAVFLVVNQKRHVVQSNRNLYAQKINNVAVKPTQQPTLKIAYAGLVFSYPPGWSAAISESGKGRYLEIRPNLSDDGQSGGVELVYIKSDRNDFGHLPGGSSLTAEHQNGPQAGLVEQPNYEITGVGASAEVWVSSANTSSSRPFVTYLIPFEGDVVDVMFFIDENYPQQAVDNWIHDFAKGIGAAATSTTPAL
jgi:hypothetical protein